ncbi:predicted protein [Chaetomium globosum CBS 148.51]|uniref:Uncharacterized protein n=1 Tax=Chaetomium globosum (strain ATCC 6205 / CBS 148.51 / DSM 1962 / NBRC 6347 / NRRL 1970) TaxID=306901 RepID=Q2H6M9_CHAGB|nr:uncharacterized protein CHGG_05686 [Chaetomium globosum CBS 148.51]EAQ89067.1 predicted protein [Chaetomium globosum CBS 148.51]
MSESPFHYQVQAGLRDYLKASLGKLYTNTKDPTIRNLIRLVAEQGTAQIWVDGKLLKQADVSFGPVGSLPALACEHDLYYHDLDQQPGGQVDLYLSDFLGSAGLPPAYCRPSTAELAAGITRNPTITLTYERLRAIFRKARHLHNPTEFTIEVGDEEESPYEEAERRVAEARAESERRVAEARAESERRVAEARAESERQLAVLKRRVAELEQQMAEGRRGAE